MDITAKKELLKELQSSDYINANYQERKHIIKNIKTKYGKNSFIIYDKIKETYKMKCSILEKKFIANYDTLNMSKNNLKKVIHDQKISWQLFPNCEFLFDKYYNSTIRNSIYALQENTNFNTNSNSTNSNNISNTINSINNDTISNTL